MSSLFAHGYLVLAYRYSSIQFMLMLMCIVLPFFSALHSAMAIALLPHLINFTYLISFSLSHFLTAFLITPDEQNAATKFQAASINGLALLALDSSALAELGIDDPAERNAILSEIQYIRLQPQVCKTRTKSRVIYIKNLFIALENYECMHTYVYVCLQMSVCLNASSREIWSRNL